MAIGQLFQQLHPLPHGRPFASASSLCYGFAEGCGEGVFGHQRVDVFALRPGIGMLVEQVL
jgi:hypothetical protein